MVSVILHLNAPPSIAKRDNLLERALMHKSIAASWMFGGLGRKTVCSDNKYWSLCSNFFCTRSIVVIVSVSHSISHFVVVVVGWGGVTITWCSIESHVAVLSWHRINGCPIGGSTTFIFLDFRCISFYLHAVSPFPLMRKSTHPPTIESIISLFLDYTQSSYKLNYVLLVCCCCFCFDDPASTYIDAEEIRPQWRIEGIFMFR